MTRRAAALNMMTVSCLIAICAFGVQTAEAQEIVEYRLLATTQTSTMERELNEASESGFRMDAVMGGETAFGGEEAVVIMSRRPGEDNEGRYQYKLLATQRTSTMEKEIQEAGDAGYVYVGQTVFNTLFGGDEVTVILERDRDNRDPGRFEYLLLATSRTSTMQNELQEAGAEGFTLVGMTVGETSFGGDEVVAILKRPE